MKQPPDVLLDRAKAMRSEPTAPEARLWYRLRAKRLAGVKFTRQDVIGPYIVDFVARAAKLVVEVDGDTHGRSGEADAKRTEWLEQRGYRVVRFANGDVMRNEGAVLQAILDSLADGPSPRPSPRKRGEGEP